MVDVMTRARGGGAIQVSNPVQPVGGTMGLQNANAVAITGGTIGGTNIAGGVVATTGNQAVQVNGYVAQAANGTPNPNFGAWYQYNSQSGLKRWIWQMLSDAETGGNAGSTLRLDRYSDAGAYLQTVMEVIRATGQVNCNGDWSHTGTLNAPTIGSAAAINPSTALTITGNVLDFALNVNNFAGADFNRKGIKIRLGNNNVDSTFLQVVGAANGNACSFSANANGVALDRRLQVTALKCASYTVATLPTIGNLSADVVDCTNLATGAEYVRWDGTNWRKFTDRAIAA